MQPPPVRFADVGGDRVAYQVFGQGTPYLHLKPLGVSLETQWDGTAHLRAWGQVARFARVIYLDHRGTGVSDALPDDEMGDVDGKLEDALAVLDALDLERTAVQGEGDGTFAAVRLAVEHPERIERLVLLNGFAKGCSGDGYEHGFPLGWWDEQAENVRRRWGDGTTAQLVSPSVGSDLALLARMERLGARPRSLAAGIRGMARQDVRHLLPKIGVPTLVMHTGDWSLATRAQSEHLAASIPGAELFTTTSSQFFWGGGALETLNEFLGGSEAVSQRELVTLLLTDVVGSTAQLVDLGDRAWRRTLESLDDVMSNRIERFGGSIVKHTGDGHLCELADPTAAVALATTLQRDAEALGIQLRCGIHTGEVERREDGDIGGMTVHIVARIADLAGGGEVIVSRTVADLLGGGVRTTSRGAHELKGLPGAWDVFLVGPG